MPRSKKTTRTPPRDDRLTARELEVWTFIALGRPTREVASLLSISESTVLTHRDSLRRKLGIPGYGAHLLSLKGVECGLVNLTVRPALAGLHVLPPHARLARLNAELFP